MSKYTLTIIILSYNTAEMTVRCLESLFDNLLATNLLEKTKVVVVDNASRDNSASLIKEFISSHQALHLVFKQSYKNLGFAGGNNLALEEIEGEFTLLLNSDAFPTRSTDLNKLIEQMNSQKEIGIITPKVVLADGSLDLACHRGFPTLWRAGMYFLGMEKIFARVPILNRIFGGYHLTHLSVSTRHEIDACTGAFLLIRSDIFKSLKGLDERYFFYAEDLDLCFQVKSLGYKIIFDPSQEILHLKNISGRKKALKTTANLSTYHFYLTMWQFFEKNLSDKYPLWIGRLLKNYILKKASRYQDFDRTS